MTVLKQKILNAKANKECFPILKKAIDYYTSSPEAFSEVWIDLKLFFKMCFLAYSIEKYFAKEWLEYAKDYDTRYFLTSMVFTPILEKIRFEAFQKVYSEIF